LLTHQIQLLFSASNPVFTCARQGKRIPNALGAVVVLALLILVSFVAVVIGVLVVTGDPKQVDVFMDGVYVLIIPFILLTILTLLWVRYFEKRPPSTLGLSRTGALFSYLRGFVLGLLFMGLVVGTMAVGGGVSTQTGGTLAGGHAVSGMVLIYLLAYIIQGGSEEVLIRGWFMQVIGARYRPWIGVLVASVLFCGFHLTPNPIAIVNLFLFALFLSFFYLREGSIWGICGWHSAWNWAMGNVFGLPVSGHEPTGGILFDLQPTGHTLLTGGDYGPEASLVTTVVFLAGIVVVVMTVRKGREGTVQKADR